MKRKSGLHKKVSSIFGETSLPKDTGAKSPLAENKEGPDMSSSGTGAPGTDRKSLNYTPGVGQGYKPAAKAGRALTEDQEYAASQRKKLYLMLVLCVVFGLALYYFNFYKPGSNNTGASAGTTVGKEIAVKDVAIHWPEPEVWPEDIRDPMSIARAATIYQPGAGTPANVEGALVLMGIVYQPQGRSQALIGKEILFEGDEIEGWTVKEIFRDSVSLKKADGEKLELNMENR